MVMMASSGKMERGRVRMSSAKQATAVAAAAMRVALKSDWRSEKEAYLHQPVCCRNAKKTASLVRMKTGIATASWCVMNGSREPSKRSRKLPSSEAAKAAACRARTAALRRGRGPGIIGNTIGRGSCAGLTVGA
jgi:hypothetical protein